MQRILQINIAGRVLPIEEDAYVLLKNYITALERQFSGPDGKDIVEDIENRIAELFSIRLQGGAPAIDREDVKKVTDTLGAPGDINDGAPGNNNNYSSTNKTTNRGGQRQNFYSNNSGRLYRDPYDKVIGGVCSGIAHYFDIDPVIIRLIMGVLFLMFGIGFVTYILAWCIIPAARTPQDLNYNNPMSFNDISNNVASELHDLKLRGEQMSRELKEFFSKKK